MRKEISLAKSFAEYYVKKKAYKFAALVVNTDCNRRCNSCLVPQTYNKESEPTVRETFSQIDWIYKQGYRFLSHLGGEPLAPIKTKENITFLDHTKQIIKYAKKKGMMVNITTNGDYANEEVIKSLKECGLDTLTFSLHSGKEQDLERLIDNAKIAAQNKIIPVIHALFTSENADQIFNIAQKVAENGILFKMSIIQEKGVFSALPRGESLMPGIEQRKSVAEGLLRLKSYGFVVDNKNYLKNLTNYPNNNWKCDAKKDVSINIEKGSVNVCSEVKTSLKTANINLKDEKWRERKAELIDNCTGCFHQCYFETENTNFAGDVPMLLMGELIKSGNFKLAEKIGKFAVQKIRGSAEKSESH
jgi:MoaA/NifB/PqqE/SkfB family radical SAM enzyme